jgi:uncharacterized protein YdeI (YjbR/CyaY-like superfamily)
MPTRTDKSAPIRQPVLLCDSQRHWDEWLAAHHSSSAGVWLQLAKQGAASPTVTYAQAVESALCYGWIDGQKASLDDAFWLQRFTPRKRRSIWSQINREKAEALIADNRMQPAGLREVQAAQADGRWEAAYAGQRSAEVPADLEQALAAAPRAREFFAHLDRANRYAILHRVLTAQKPETRARRIATLVAMLAEHKKLH